MSPAGHVCGVSAIENLNLIRLHQSSRSPPEAQCRCHQLRCSLAPLFRSKARHVRLPVVTSLLDVRVCAHATQRDRGLIIGASRIWAEKGVSSEEKTSSLEIYIICEDPLHKIFISPMSLGTAARIAPPSWWPVVVVGPGEIVFCVMPHATTGQGSSDRKGWCELSKYEKCTTAVPAHPQASVA
jgi:hypothetical protein